MKNYKKFLELKEKLKKYANGGEINVGQQTPQEAGEEAKARRSAVLKNAGISPEQSLDEIEIEAAEKRKRQLEKELNLYQRYARGGQVGSNNQVEESQQKQYQAKDHFGKGFEGHVGTVPQLNEGGSPIDAEIEENKKMVQTLGEPPFDSDPRAKELQRKYLDSMKDALDRKAKSIGHFDGGDILAKLSEPTDEEVKSYNEKRRNSDDLISKQIRDLENQKTNKPSIGSIKIKKYADGGSVNTATNLAPLLKESYAIKEKKRPINIPRAEKLKIPKRLKSLDFLKGYDDGGNVIQGDEQFVPASILESQYVPEEEAANQAAGMAPDAKNQDDLLSKIDEALGKSPEEKPVDQKHPWYANKEGVLEGMKDEGEGLQEPGKSELPAQEEIAKPKRPDSDKAIEESVQTSADEEALKDAEKKAIKPEPSEEEPYNPIKALKEAQEGRNQAQMWNQLGAIAERGAAGYAGIKPTQQETYKENMAIAQQAVDDVKARIAQQGDDPNSPVSKTFRKYLEKFSGEPVDPRTTANIGKEVLPFAFKDFEAKEKAKEVKMNLEARNQERLQQTQLIVEQRREAAKQHAELMAAMGAKKEQSAKEKAAEKQDQHDVDRVDKMNVKINAAMGNSRSAFGTAAKNKQSVENVKALLEGVKDFNDLDNRQIVETARVLDRILSGGVSTISGSEHLTPDSARQWMAKKWEFITSKRQGAGAASFIKTMADTIEREGQQADRQILKAQTEFMGPYKSIEKNNKDSRSYQNYINALKSNHLDALLPKDEQETSAKSEEKVLAKKVVRKGYNAKTNQTQLIYDDGSSEIKDGKL